MDIISENGIFFSNFEHLLEQLKDESGKKFKHPQPYFTGKFIICHQNVAKPHVEGYWGPRVRGELQD